MPRRRWSAIPAPIIEIDTTINGNTGPPVNGSVPPLVATVVVVVPPDCVTGVVTLGTVEAVGPSVVDGETSNVVVVDPSCCTVDVVVGCAAVVVVVGCCTVVVVLVDVEVEVDVEVDVLVEVEVDVDVEVLVDVDVVGGGSAVVVVVGCATVVVVVGSNVVDVLVDVDVEVEVDVDVEVLVDVDVVVGATTDELASCVDGPEPFGFVPVPSKHVAITRFGVATVPMFAVVPATLANTFTGVPAVDGTMWIATSGTSRVPSDPPVTSGPAVFTETCVELSSVALPETVTPFHFGLPAGVGASVIVPPVIVYVVNRLR